jgi:hypothetical protein
VAESLVNVFDLYNLGLVLGGLPQFGCQMYDGSLLKNDLL